jgi:hypothetical protein
MRRCGFFVCIYNCLELRDVGSWCNVCSLIRIFQLHLAAPILPLVCVILFPSRDILLLQVIRSALILHITRYRLTSIINIRQGRSPFLTTKTMKYAIASDEYSTKMRHIVGGEISYHIEREEQDLDRLERIFTRNRRRCFAKSGET